MNNIGESINLQQSPQEYDPRIAAMLSMSGAVLNPVSQYGQEFDIDKPFVRERTVSPNANVGQRLHAVIEAGDELFGIVKAESLDSVDTTNDSAYILTRMTPAEGGERATIVGVLREGDYPLELGRYHQPDMNLSESVSRNHAQMSIKNGKLHIEDSGSANGTKIITAESTTQQNPFIDDISKWAPASMDVKNALASSRADDPNNLAPETAEIYDQESQLAKEILAYEVLGPQQKIEAGGREFAISSRIQSAGREFAILWSNQDGRAVPRLMYKSNSAGDWRTAYRYSKRDGYDKGASTSGRYHYTQANKLHDNIAEALDSDTNIVQDPEGGFKQFFERTFNEDNPSASQVDTAAEEVSFDQHANELLSDFSQYLTAGGLGKERADAVKTAFGSVGEYFRSLDKSFKKLKGFTPDFAVAPTYVKTQEHPLLGEYTVEAYESELDGRPVMWTMGMDADGRTWIDGIKFNDVEPSSYGTGNVIIDSGVLTSKPIDYEPQTTSLDEGTEVRDIPGLSGRYRDISPVLANLLPIREYRKAKGLPVPKPKRKFTLL